MANDIANWLGQLGLEKYATVFDKNEITMATLPFITDSDLREIDVPLGPRRHILAAIGNLDQPTSTAENVTSSAPKVPLVDQNRPFEPNSRLSTEVVAQPDASRRQVTILFSDISGYTSLTNTMDAEDIHAMLNGYFEVVGKIVARYGGTIDKHIGDAVMAVFGAKVSHTNDPERAVLAARDIHDAVGKLRTPVAVHIGIAAGQVVASSTGGTEHTEYTVIGDSVNLAARLTDLAETNQTLISASVRQAVGDRFVGEALGKQVIAGLPEPVHVWRISDLTESSGFSRRTFVGRETERKTLETAVSNCIDGGNGKTLIVRGEAGIGKTRLLEEFEQIAFKQGMHAHTSLVLDFGATQGQDAVGSLVRSLLGLSAKSNVDERNQALDRVIVEELLDESHRVFMNDLLDLEQDPALRGLYDTIDNKARNRGKLETVTNLVVNISQRHPLLIKVEDLHWADQFVLEQVAFLARSAAKCQFLQILTTRLAGDQLDEVWKSRCDGAPVETIDLIPITSENAIEIGKSFDDIPVDLLNSCIERSGGNPLFLEQLLQNVDATSQGQLPGTVQGIVQARVDALSAQDRLAMQAASTLGQRFSLDTIAAMIDSDDYEPDELVRQSLIRPAGEDFHFAHALIRDGVYSSLLKPRRVDLHKRAAQWFRDTEPVLHAEHLDQANSADAASAYFAAAKIQQDGFRFSTALRLVRRALELDQTFDCMCFEGDLLRDLGESAESIFSYERALSAAATDEERCKAHIGMASGMRITGQNDKALAVLDQAEEIAQEHQLSAALAELHSLRGNLLFPLGRIEECLKSNELSLMYAKRCGSPEAEVRALGGVGDAYYASGKMRTAQDYFARCVKLAEQHGLTRTEVANRPMWAWTSYFLATVDPVKEMAFMAMERAQETGNIRAELIAHDVLSETFFQLGDLENSKHHGLQILKLTRSIGSTLFEGWGSIILGRFQMYADRDYRSAFDTLKEGYNSCRTTSESFIGPWLLGSAALASENDGDRKWALGEGERILDAGAVSHNYFFFYADAMEVSRRTANWSELHRYADALDLYTRDEPLEWSNFYLKRARLLARVGVGETGPEVVKLLNELHKEAKEGQFVLAQQAIDEALQKISGDGEKLV